MLTLSKVTDLFNTNYPYGTITKLSNTKYSICYDNRDYRTDSEKEMETYYNYCTDTRKSYIYYAKNLKELAIKLKLETPETEFKLSKVNQEWEEMLKDNTDYSFELFGE